MNWWAVFRRVAVLVSVLLLVAVVGGFLARRATVARDHDEDLMATAQLAASEFNGLVSSVEAVALGGDESRVALAAITEVESLAEVCVADGDGDQHCSGPVLAEVETDGRIAFEARDSSFAITIRGAVLSVTFSGPIERLSDGSGALARLATRLPDGAQAGDFVSAAGYRQALVSVERLDGVYMVAETTLAPQWSSGERGLYLFGVVAAVALLGVAGIAYTSERRDLEERASTDSLTRVANRSEIERLGRRLVDSSVSSGRPLAVMLFDLNRFKTINDTYGHAAGDEMLSLVASRLVAATEGDEVVGRWGGDEFVVVMPGVVDADEAVERADRISDQIVGRVRLGTGAAALRLELSAGVAMCPENGTHLLDLIAAADDAMYHAKRQGAPRVLAGSG